MCTFRKLVQSCLAAASVGCVLCPTESWSQVGPPPQVRSFQASPPSPQSPAPLSAAPTSTSQQQTPAASAAATQPPQPSAQRFATNRRTFAIPFAVDNRAEAIVGVNLFVSFDRGQTWEQHSQIALAKSAFDFAAQQQGEFWFAVQTVSRTGERTPPTVTSADLIVLVDEQVPTIEVTAADDAAGRLQVSWTASDEHLASSSVKIRYRPLPAGGDTWWEVPAQLPAGEALGPIYRDSLAFWPEGEATAYEIAVTIADLAGNEATGRTTCNRLQPKQMLVDARQPNLPNAGSVLQESLRKPPDPASLPMPTEWPSQVEFPGGQQVIEQSARTALPNMPPATPSPVTSDVQTNQSLPATLPPAVSSGTAVANSAPALMNAPATTTPAAMPISSRQVPAQNASDRQSILAPSDVLEQAIPVNSNRFRLNYQVDSLALTDFQEVVVWVTRDQGATWNRLGASPNPQGPYAVSVDGSGLFGFRLVVTGRNGLKGRIPQPGDPADKWVLVDIDSPQVRITGAPFGTGEHAGKLVIQWQVNDQRLDLRPIDLEYSTSPEGPWALIERNLRNNGVYAWPVDPNSIEKVYLRITARDAAGNRGVDQTTQPIDLGNLFPRGRIDSVEPIR